MANKSPEKTHEVFTPIKARTGLSRIRLGAGVEHSNGEIEIDLIGSPINGKLIVVPIRKGTR